MWFLFISLATNALQNCTTPRLYPLGSIQGPKAQRCPINLVIFRYLSGSFDFLLPRRWSKNSLPIVSAFFDKIDSTTSGNKNESQLGHWFFLNVHFSEQNSTTVLFAPRSRYLKRLHFARVLHRAPNNVKRRVVRFSNRSCSYSVKTASSQICACFFGNVFLYSCFLVLCKSHKVDDALWTVQDLCKAQVFAVIETRIING